MVGCGTPHFTPQVMIMFSRKTHGPVGETHHFRKPPSGNQLISLLLPLLLFVASVALASVTDGKII